MTKKARQQPSPPPAFEPITGPTKQTMQHADYERRDVNKDEPRPYVRTTSTLVDRLLLNRTITRQQSEGAKEYAKDHVTIHGSPGSRDSCVQRIGGMEHETEEQAEWIVRAKQRHQRVLNRIGPMAYSILRQVAVYDEPLGRSDTEDGRRRYAAMRHAMDTAADVYGVPV